MKPQRRRIYETLVVNNSKDLTEPTEGNIHGLVYIVFYIDGKAYITIITMSHNIHHLQLSSAPGCCSLLGLGAREQLLRGLGLVTYLGFRASGAQGSQGLGTTGASKSLRLSLPSLETAETCRRKL